MLNLVASYKMRTRQIHRGLGARGCANPKGRGAGDGKYAAVAADTAIGLWSMATSTDGTRSVTFQCGPR
jgi:hypothetical protein